MAADPRCGGAGRAVRHAFRRGIGWPRAHAVCAEGRAATADGCIPWQAMQRTRVRRRSFDRGLGKHGSCEDPVGAGVEPAFACYQQAAQPLSYPVVAIRESNPARRGGIPASPVIDRFRRRGMRLFDEEGPHRRGGLAPEPRPVSAGLSAEDSLCACFNAGAKLSAAARAAIHARRRGWRGPPAGRLRSGWARRAGRPAACRLLPACGRP